MDERGKSGTIEAGDKSIPYLIDRKDFSPEKDLVFSSAEDWKELKKYLNELADRDPGRNLSNRVFAMAEEEAYQLIMEEAAEDFARKHGRQASDEELESLSREEKNKIRDRLIAEGKIKTRNESFDVTDEEIESQKKEFGEPTKEGIVRERDRKFEELFKKYYEKYLTVHGTKRQNKTDLDGKCALGLFKKVPGFENLNLKKDVEYIAPGGETKGRVNIDTSNKEGVIHEYGVDRETNKLHWDTTTSIDHHDPELSLADSSATEWVYESLTQAGLLERDPVLDQIVQFVSQVDNAAYPDQEKYFDSGDRRLIGLWRLAEFWGLQKFFKDGKDPTETLSDDDLKKYGFIFPKTENGKPVIGSDGKPEMVNFQKTQREIIERSKEQIKEAEANGYGIESNGHFGKIFINVSGLPGGYDAVRAAGYDTYIVWAPKPNNFFFISSKDGFPETFSPGDGFVVRGKMWRTEAGRTKDLEINLEQLLKAMLKDEFEQFKPSGKLLERIENEKKGIFKPTALVTEEGESAEAETELEAEPEPEPLGIKEQIEKSFNVGAVWISIGASVNARKYLADQNKAEDGSFIFELPEGQFLEIKHSFGEGELEDDEVVVKSEQNIEVVLKAKDLVWISRPAFAESMQPDEKQHLKVQFDVWLLKNKRAERFIPKKEEPDSEIQEKVKYFDDLTDEKIESFFAPDQLWILTGESVKAEMFREEEEKLIDFNLRHLKQEEYKIIGAFENSPSKKTDDVSIEYIQRDGKKIRFDIAVLDFLDALKPKNLLYISSKKKRQAIAEKFEDWAKKRLLEIENRSTRSEPPQKTESVDELRDRYEQAQPIEIVKELGMEGLNLSDRTLDRTLEPYLSALARYLKKPEIEKRLKELDQQRIGLEILGIKIPEEADVVKIKLGLEAIIQKLYFEEMSEPGPSKENEELGSNLEAKYENGKLRFKKDGDKIEIAPGIKRKWIAVRDNQDVIYTVESIEEVTPNEIYKIKFVENPIEKTKTLNDWEKFFTRSVEVE